MNLARRFNAGSAQPFALVASATADSRAFQASLARREHPVNPYPALKRRAKFIPPLRVEDPSPKLSQTFHTVSVAIGCCNQPAQTMGHPQCFERVLSAACFHHTVATRARFYLHAASFIGRQPAQNFQIVSNSC